MCATIAPRFRILVRRLLSLAPTLHIGQSALVTETASPERRLRGRLRLLLMFGVLLIAGLVATFFASRGGSCDESAASSLSVYVTDASGTEVCDAKVTATDGSEVFPMHVSGCTYVGPFERAGTYVVNVSRDGYSAASGPIHIGSGECHVEGKRVDLTLSA